MNSKAVSFRNGGKEEEKTNIWSNSSGYASTAASVKEVNGSPEEHQGSSSQWRNIRRKSSTAKLAIERTVRTRERLWSVSVSSLISSIPMLLVGFNIGFPSPVLSDMSADSVPPEHQFDTLLLALFAAFAPVGALFGGPVAGWVVDHYGRKPTLLLSGIPFLIGFLMISYAHFFSTTVGFRAMMLIGRLVTGFSQGWSCLAVPVYIGEISSAKLRGIFGTFTQLYLGGGLVVVFSLGSIPGFQYYNIALVACGIVAVFELGMVWLYDTPRWLFTKGRKDEGERVLEWLRGPKIGISEELHDLEVAVSSKKLTIVQVFKEFTKWRVIFPLLLVNMMMFFQQIGGLNAISMFASLLFKEAGVSNPDLTSLYAVAMTAFVSTLISGYVVDVAGRKLLLVISGIGMLLGTTMLGTHFYITRPSLCPDHHNSTAVDSFLPYLQDSTNSDGTCNSQYAPLAITSLILFNISFAFGWGPVPWIQMSELLPMQIRGVASGIATFVNWATAGIVVGFYLDYSKTVGTWVAWWSFALMNLLGVVFVALLVPETKGKTLEEIQEKFERGRRKVEAADTLGDKDNKPLLDSA